MLRTVLGQCDIATKTVPELVSAEVPALVTVIPTSTCVIRRVTSNYVNFGHILNITGDVSPKLDV